MAASGPNRRDFTARFSQPSIVEGDELDEGGLLFFSLLGLDGTTDIAAAPGKEAAAVAVVVSDEPAGLRGTAFRR